MLVSHLKGIEAPCLPARLPARPTLIQLAPNNERNHPLGPFSFSLLSRSDFVAITRFCVPVSERNWKQNSQTSAVRLLLAQHQAAVNHDSLLQCWGETTWVEAYCKCRPFFFIISVDLTDFFDQLWWKSCGDGHDSVELEVLQITLGKFKFVAKSCNLCKDNVLSQSEHNRVIFSRKVFSHLQTYPIWHLIFVRCILGGFQNVWLHHCHTINANCFVFYC